jgi:chaperonin cofactor prefoldin
LGEIGNEELERSKKAQELLETNHKKLDEKVEKYYRDHEERLSTLEKWKKELETKFSDLEARMTGLPAPDPKANGNIAQIDGLILSLKE